MRHTKTITDKVSCRLQQTCLGWWLEFPDNPNAGLLFETDSDKISFAKSCGVDLPSDEILYLNLDEITECYLHWYDEACHFPILFE